MADDLMTQGVELLRQGDKDAARSIFEQAVQQEPENAQAWYYLAAATSRLYDRRQALERVLQIDPDHEKAKAQLAKLDVGSNANQSGATIAEPDNGLKLPIDIPGAPEFVTPEYLINSFIEKFKNGIAILRQEPGIYAQEVQRASWWNFWSYVGIVYVLSALAGTIRGAITVSMARESLNVFFILTTFIFTIPLGIGVLYIGLKASHWYITNQANGQGSFVAHAYAIMLPATTISVISAVVTLVFSILPFFGRLAGLGTLILAIYGLYIAANGIRMVHKVAGNTVWITLAVMILAQIGAGLVLGLILSPLLLTSGVGSFM